MEFDIASTPVSFPWLASAGIFIGFCLVIFPLLRLLFPGRLSYETNASFISAGFATAVVSGYLGLMVLIAVSVGASQDEEEAAVAALQQQAKEVYGVALTTDQATQLLGGTNTEELNGGFQGLDVQRAGSIDRAEDGVISSVELVWLEGEWVLASGESNLEEMPRTGR